MRKRRLVVIAIVAMVLMLIVAGFVVRAQQQQPALSPDRVLRGTTPAITITLDKSIKEIKSVHVGGQNAEFQQPDAEGKVLVQLPKLDIVGRANVEVIGKDDKTLASGQVTYSDSTESPSIPVLGRYTGLGLLLAYVALIVLLPIWATMYDIHKSYEERSKVFEKLIKPGSATTEDATALLKNMDQGPTGLVGLTRGLVALTLILVLAFAAFHLIIFAPKVPDIAEKLLMLLAGTLTAITGFYFGSKAATEAATAAAPQTLSGATKTQVPATPKISNVDPPSGSANAKVKVNGEGFGDSQGKGTVTVGGKNATVTNSKWNDKQIEITIPSDVQPPEVDIVVTNDNGNSSEPKKFGITIVTARQTSSGGTMTQVPVTPKISNVDPPSGSANTKVKVNGEGFGDLQGKGNVTVGGKNATVTISKWNDKQIEITIPSAQAGKVDIVVTNDNGNSSEPKKFDVI